MAHLWRRFSWILSCMFSNAHSLLWGKTMNAWVWTLKTLTWRARLRSATTNTWICSQKCDILTIRVWLRRLSEADIAAKSHLGCEYRSTTHFHLSSILIGPTLQNRDSRDTSNSFLKVRIISDLTKFWFKCHFFCWILAKLKEFLGRWNYISTKF